MLANAASDVAGADRGARNNTLFVSAMKCGSFITGAGLDEDAVVDALVGATQDCGLTDEDGKQAVYATIASGFRIGNKNPRAVPDEKADSAGGQRREIEWISLEDIKDAAPKWAWTYDGCGRIQIAALTLFGGRPGTGKSTGRSVVRCPSQPGRTGGGVEGQAAEGRLHRRRGDGQVRPQARAARGRSRHEPDRHPEGQDR